MFDPRTLFFNLYMGPNLFHDMWAPRCVVCTTLICGSKFVPFQVVGGKSASTDTYGDRAPFLVRRGVEVARRADRGDAHKGFTQLWAAQMRKTLLPLCGFG